MKFLSANPAGGMGPFIMNPEGVARFFARAGMAEGPFPEHYEPFETPLGYNPLNTNKAHATNNPAARVFPDDRKEFGTAEHFPNVATTCRLTEHFHYWTKHARLNSIIQPQQFVEIGEGLANEVGIVTGERVKVSSNRGFIKAVAMVTKRIRPLTVDGKTIHTVGVPIHWGFMGVAKPGFLANTLTPSVGDVVVALSGLLASGIVIWRAYFAAYFPIDVLRLAALTHAFCAFVLVCAIIVHIYAAIWVKGSIPAMTRGRVSVGWAWKHHRDWLRQMTKSVQPK